MTAEEFVQECQKRKGSCFVEVSPATKLHRIDGTMAVDVYQLRVTFIRGSLTFHHEARCAVAGVGQELVTALNRIDAL